MELDPEILLRCAVALGIGAMLGAEREVRKGERARGLSGLRTFTLISLVGAVCGLLTFQLQQPLALVGGLIAVLAVELSRSRASAREDPGRGVTGTYAALAAYLLAALAVQGELLLAVALGVAGALVLALKDPVHSALSRLGDEDVIAGLQLLAATFIILPLLPSEPVDPWGVLPLRILWLLVILIASLSLMGYAASRWLGHERGAVLTGLFGGLVSSTAVTLAFARRSRELPTHSLALAAGVLVAWGSMPFRMLVEVAVVNRALLPPLVPACLGMALPGAVIAAVLVFGHRGPDGPGQPDMTNPFSLPRAIQFAALFAVVLLAVEAAQRFELPGGVLLVSALAGATDVDAITLTLAQQTLDGLDVELAATAAVVAALTNTAVKAGFALVLGSPALRRVVVGAGVLIAIGAAAGIQIGRLLG